MSVVSSIFEWTRQPNQMDKLSEEEKKNVLHLLIKGIKNGDILISLEGNKAAMLIKTPFNGIITCFEGDIIFIVRTKNYPSYLMSSPSYFIDQIIYNYEKTQGGNNETRSYPIYCV